MFGFSLGVGLANRFVAWWGDWRLALDFTAGRYHPKGGAGLVLTEDRASSALVLQGNGTYVERAAGELAIGQGVGLQVSAAVTNLFLNPTLQGQTSWIAGGDGNSDLTANAGVDPTGAQVASVFENQSAHNYGSQFYQGVAIVDTEMTISLWAYAAEEVAASLKLNDNENNHDITIGTTMQRFDHTGTIGPALLGGVGRCGFATGEDWRGKGVVIAWLQITVGKAAPFALGTRAADNPVVVQGAGGKPWPGYDITGQLSGVELVELGSFDDISALDNWTTNTLSGTGTCTIDVIAGQFYVTNSDPLGTGYGIAYYDWAAEAGTVYEVVGEQVSGVNSNAYNMGFAGDETPFDVFVNKSLADGARQFIAPQVDMRLSVNAAGQVPSASRVVDNLSIQKVEPGVVFEIKAKWGVALGQHAFRFDEGASSNIILVQKTGAGTVKLLVRADGVDAINFASAVLWPSDTEATFRLEITKTDAGTFFALFLDDVYIDDIPAGPVDYPEAINQLKLAPVEGVSVIKQVYGK